MTMNERMLMRRSRGVGLIEVMISIIIAMLLVLVIYQVYEISESQKRTITGGSDAQQNASYGLYVLGRDLAMAGNGIASAAASLDGCALLRPIPVLIEAGGTAEVPDTITVLYGGSSSLSTPVRFTQDATGAQAYVVRGPVGFSADPKDPDKTDRIVAIQGTNCTLSRISPGGVAVDAGTGIATLTHTPVAGVMNATYNESNATLVNLGQQKSMGRITYSVPTDCQTDPTACSLRTQNQLPSAGQVIPVISDVVNLKAQYGLDNNCDGTITWQPATSPGPWSSDSVPTLPLATPVPCVAPAPPALQQIRAVRIAIVTRSSQCEREKVTVGPLKMFENPDDPNDPNTVKMQIEDSDQPCTPRYYRYKVLETVVPLRNALWNGS